MAPSEQMDTPSTPAAQRQSDASVPKVGFYLTFLTMSTNFVVFVSIVHHRVFACGGHLLQVCAN